MALRGDRHLTQILSPPAARLDEPARPGPPPELDGPDYVRLLLRTAAGIEHALMAQYLFTAYSLGRSGAPASLRSAARAWQETMLGIAKEEMAHLLTVQNLLVALGERPSFERDDYPHDSPFYPFGFSLRPASLATLATYVCAESPADWDEPDTVEIMELARADTGDVVNSVGLLYAELERVLTDPAYVPDNGFAGAAYQAGWAEWGRGYRAGQRGSEASEGLPGLPAPELIVLTVRSRADALAAARAIGEQGEAFTTPPNEDESHFRRFLAIYRAMREVGDDLALVVRPIAANPTTAAMPGTDPADPATASPLTHPESLLWGHLFNVRYRMLLVGLAHLFEPGPARGGLINRCFVEMYHLRTIAGQLVRLPLDAEEPDGPRAGPPFEMPHSLALPATESDRWRLHRDLVDASAALLNALKELGVAGDAQDFLLALAQSDAAARVRLDRLAGGGTS